MWRRKTRVAERQPVEVDCALDELEALELRILRILEEAGAGQSLSHARREIDDLAVMLIASGTSTFLQFDRSLERLESHGMIRLDTEGFAGLSERGRDRISPTGLPPREADGRKAPVPVVA
jgi:hypothetical protein